MNDLDEYALEARLGLEPALRRLALPRTGSREAVSASTWLLDPDRCRRQELSRTDRAVCALLIGRALLAAQQVESAGPVGAALVCLRASVRAHRLWLEDEPDDDSHSRSTAAKYVSTMSQNLVVPFSDRHVWRSSIESAEVLYANIVGCRADPRWTPLQAIAKDLVARSLLSRRAFAALFVSRFAAALLAAEARRGTSASDSARQQVALTIAYVAGEVVVLRGNHLRVMDGAGEPGPLA